MTSRALDRRLPASFRCRAGGAVSCDSRIARAPRLTLNRPCPFLPRSRDRRGANPRLTRVDLKHRTHVRRLGERSAHGWRGRVRRPRSAARAATLGRSAHGEAIAPRPVRSRYLSGPHLRPASSASVAYDPRLRRTVTLKPYTGQRARHCERGSWRESCVGGPICATQSAGNAGLRERGADEGGRLRWKCPE